MTNVTAKNLINGEWVGAQDGAMGTSRNPANQEAIGSFPASGLADAKAAIAAAAAAFELPNWAQNPRLRQLVMLRWADRLEQRAEYLAQLLTRENGKVIAQSRGELIGAVSEIRYYAGLTRYIPGHAFEVEPGVYSTMIKEPAGVAGIIVPWNAPVVLLIRSLTPALCAGCTTVIKPAPQTALITYEVLRDLHEAQGLPPGVLNLVSETGHAVAQELVASPDVSVISFTGSNATGARIMADAAPTMKKLSLELGGKSCCLVFPDADPSVVAPALAQAAVIISGQQCTAARRILVHGSRYDEMKAALTQSFKDLRVGFGEAAGMHMGPLIDTTAVRHVQERVQMALDTCDEVILKGGRLGGDLQAGNFLAPTLVAHRDTGAFFCQEEIFGPFVVLERFEDEKEAVARTNHTEYGLSASVWTNDGARAMRVSRAIRSGTIWINDHNKLFAEAETGGYRKSGIGRLHGYDALVDFLEIKHIYQNAGVV
ncbi:aldehyde dehydrogenase family protein [Lacisediminimonas sp.]|uniref:aldehyde dehydrogenase family protein n=1 Tax=Lacisediminimonas sp. TaxID=3060582 RepID=UPI00271A0608|nr:aldehyde dehydrogenase family protein [Lacisediminimonas sp.]MDO8298170.1 aldehyde dehydrogenase family protein [Lacisediminimonas sp.]